ncbi:cell division protein ZapE [Marinomonas fungiae]|uniref:cell division protein ZapE n=1 Tax=Marinomonas fungiae TaxID=1137284 RepID=UPI003A903820
MLNPPSELYRQRVQTGEIENDAFQAEALAALDTLWQQLSHEDIPHNPSLGVYLWGSVGRGKTMLMDLFFQSLPDGIGRRQHFHHFMSDLHRELNTTFGVANPLRHIAARMAREVKVICFDEFFVSDIADAMLLGNLIQGLFDEGGYLVATSNIPISGLFQNQLQKDRFAPTIDVLESRLLSFHFAGKKDHRFRLPADQKIFFTCQSEFDTCMSSLFGERSSLQGTIRVNHRELPYLQQSESILWCDFKDLCVSPRSAQDYIRLAQEYSCIVVSNIPELSGTPFEHIKARGTEDGAVGSGQTGEREVSQGIHDDAVRRFISLVDECYDQRIKMLFQSDVALESLYRNGILLFEFQRTFSRISEMQTAGYIY